MHRLAESLKAPSFDYENLMAVPNGALELQLLQFCNYFSLLQNEAVFEKALELENLLSFIWNKCKIMLREQKHTANLLNFPTPY